MPHQILNGYRCYYDDNKHKISNSGSGNNDDGHKYCYGHRHGHDHNNYDDYDDSIVPSVGSGSDSSSGSRSQAKTKAKIMLQPVPAAEQAVPGGDYFVQIPQSITRSNIGGFSVWLKAVYGALLSSVGPNQTCELSQQTLAARAGCGTTKLTEVLRHLRMLGLVTWQRRGQGQPNVYRVGRLALLPPKDPELGTELRGRDNKGRNGEETYYHPATSSNHHQQHRSVNDSAVTSSRNEQPSTSTPTHNTGTATSNRLMTTTYPHTNMEHKLLVDNECGQVTTTTTATKTGVAVASTSTTTKPTMAQNPAPRGTRTPCGGYKLDPNTSDININKDSNHSVGGIKNKSAIKGKNKSNNSSSNNQSKDSGQRDTNMIMITNSNHFKRNMPYSSQSVTPTTTTATASTKGDTYPKHRGREYRNNHANGSGADIGYKATTTVSSPPPKAVSAPEQSLVPVVMSSYICRIMEDFSRALGDVEHVRSNQTQACRLFAQSGRSQDKFVELLYEAKKRTQWAALAGKLGSDSSDSDDDGGSSNVSGGYSNRRSGTGSISKPKPKRGAYFFVVLRDLLAK